jgi:formamidopyrimidine-DNA glycosylase
MHFRFDGHLIRLLGNRSTYFCAHCQK